MLDKGVNNALHVARALLQVGRRLDNAREHLLVLCVEVRARVHALLPFERAEPVVDIVITLRGRARRKRRHVERAAAPDLSAVTRGCCAALVAAGPSMFTMARVGITDGGGA